MGRLATSNACSTLHVSMTMKKIDRHIDTNMIPNRGATITSSTIPNEYTLLIIQTMEIVVKIHQVSLWSCQTGKNPAVAEVLYRKSGSMGRVVW